jgi:glutamyl-tRNA synthetase
MKKLEAINGDKIRALSAEEFLSRALPFLKKAEVITGTNEEISLVKQALPIIQERIVKLGEIPAMLKFLFVDDLVIDSESKEKIKDDLSKDVLKRALEVLELLGIWSHDSIESALRAALIEDMGLKPRIAFGAVRIAATGSHISPPLFESMELLGKDASISRIKAAISL